jgi:predicted nuclease of predicted toxin-antitoxin system
MAKPKLLLDENIGKLVTGFLREQGYDVLSILEEFPGIKDKEVLVKAVREDRILVTLDKDFGTLVYHYSRKHVGVILLRLKKESATHISTALLTVLTNYSEQLMGRFITASENQIRIR